MSAVNTRGRPAGRMTPHRRRAAEEVRAQLAEGKRIIVARVARKLEVDRRSARRIIADVQRMGLVGI